MERSRIDDYSLSPPFDYEGFTYDGFPNSDSCGDASERSPDDFSRESEGICRVNYREYSYDYDVINRHLEEKPDLKELTGLERVNTCAGAHLFVAAKNYLGGLETFDVPDPTIEPVEDPAFEHTEDGDIGVGDVVPLIWKGFRFDSENESVVHYRLSKSGRSTWCTGLVINDIWLLTAAHCVNYPEFIPTGTGATCNDCMVAYWTNPWSGTKECITDSTPGNAICQSQKTVWIRKHLDFSGDADYGDDVALIRFSAGWNRSIKLARLYSATPSLWTGYSGIGYGHNSMCSGTEAFLRSKRWGSFDLTTVYSKYVKTNAADDYRWCVGDSGGALNKFAGFSAGYGYNIYLTFGIHSGSGKGVCAEGGDSSGKTFCASPTGRYQNAARVDQKISWIRQYTGLSCPGSTLNGLSYVYCMN